jgi:uncharacterized membrane protein YqhA
MLLVNFFGQYNIFINNLTKIKKNKISIILSNASSILKLFISLYELKKQDKRAGFLALFYEEVYQ